MRIIEIIFIKFSIIIYNIYYLKYIYIGIYLFKIIFNILILFKINI